KLLDLPGLGMSVTAIRVPIFFGSAFSVNLETESPLAAAQAADILRRAPGILLHDEAADSYPTPAEVAGSDATHVGRVRDDRPAGPRAPAAEPQRPHPRRRRRPRRRHRRRRLRPAPGRAEPHLRVSHLERAGAVALLAPARVARAAAARRGRHGRRGPRAGRR